MEFFLKGTNSATVIADAKKQVKLSPEVNQIDTVELMVSMAADIGILNMRLLEDILTLYTITQRSGGLMYAGSSLLRDTSEREPAWYRSTSLSKQLARGFLNSGSQQLVIGIAPEGGDNNSGEQFGIELYSFLRQLSPIILALSASSPFLYEANNSLRDSGFESYRPGNYQNMSAQLPFAMFDTPIISSLDDYHDNLRLASNQVNQLLDAGQLDANLPELYRDREQGPYAPFDELAWHQVYSWIRIRPDHANEDSVFSLEVRIADLANRVELMQAINSFVGGLSYYASRFGFEELQNAVASMNLQDKALNPALLRTARNGLDTRVGTRNNGTTIRQIVPQLAALATEGLIHRNIDPTMMNEELNRVLCYGNEATQTRQFVSEQQPTAEQLEQYLILRLLQSLQVHV
jgi:gamma-glutamyl:cysteine ligase YbdK (ATP-grasp superfamily)